MKRESNVRAYLMNFEAHYKYNELVHHDPYI